MSIENDIRIRKVKTEAVEPPDDIYVVDVLVDVSPWWRRWLYLPPAKAWKPLRETMAGFSEMMLFGIVRYFSPYGDGDVKIFESYDAAQEAVDDMIERWKAVELQNQLKGTI